MEERRARGRERSTSNQDRERRNEIKMKKGEKSDRKERTRAVGKRDKGGSLIYLHILTN